jgi:hypothetical protein
MALRVEDFSEMFELLHRFQRLAEIAARATVWVAEGLSKPKMQNEMFLRFIIFVDLS